MYVYEVRGMGDLLNQIRIWSMTLVLRPMLGLRYSDDATLT
jgi:hypothetical protein